jgi:hypothetical protein
VGCGRVRGDKVLFDVDFRDAVAVRNSGFKIETGARIGPNGLSFSAAAVAAFGVLGKGDSTKGFQNPTPYFVRFVIVPVVAYNASVSSAYLWATGNSIYGPLVARTTGYLYFYPGGEYVALTAANWQVGVPIEIGIYYDPASGYKVYWNGALVINRVGSWSPYYGLETTVYVGSDYDGTHYWVDTIQRAQLVQGTLTTDALADLVAKDETEELQPENARLWLPMRRVLGAGTAGDPKKTPNLGSLGSACDAYLGDNGQGGSDEPVLVSPHGLYCTATQYITSPDASLLSFGNGVVDSVFSWALCCKVDTYVNHSFMGKGGASGQGEWCDYVVGANDYFILRDSIRDKLTYCYVAHSGFKTGTPFVAVFTYSGAGNASGIRIYSDGVQLATTVVHDAAYVAMSSGSDVWRLRAHSAVANNVMIAYEAAIFPFELTPRQVSILTEQMLSRVNV